MIVAIWILTLAVNTPVLTTYSAVEDETTGIHHCMISSPLASRQLYATFFAFAYLIPLAVIVICSVGILRHITYHKSVKHHMPCGDTKTS